MKRLLAALALAGVMFAQTPTIVTNERGNQEIYWQAVPTSLTAVISTDARLFGVTIYNSTGSAITFTFQTRDATPLPLPLSGSVAANTSAHFNIPVGLLSKAGFSVQASATGLYYAASWRR